jgi:riboflavin biosynthesis pyrimidine reductase
VRQIYPVQGRELELAARASAGPLPAAVRELAALYGNGADGHSADSPRMLRANMVASTDGAAELDGRSGGLSGPGDRMIFTVLRSMAHLILVGAGTVTAERYRPVQAEEIWAGLRPEGAPVPAIAVVTGRLNLDPDCQLLTGAPPEAQTIVITTAAAPADRKAAIARHARIIEAGQHGLDLAAAVSTLHGLGYASILTEGGPRLLGHLAAAGLIDELCLTTSPVLSAGSAGRIVSALPPSGASAQLSLEHVLTDDGFLFSRYLRQPLSR